MDAHQVVSFNAATRAATGRGAGDEVEVRVELDDSPRTVEVPDALEAALRSDESATAAWQALTPSKQKAYALSVSSAKTEETQRRRVAQVLDALRS